MKKIGGPSPSLFSWFFVGPFLRLEIRVREQWEMKRVLSRPHIKWTRTSPEVPKFSSHIWCKINLHYDFPRSLLLSRCRDQYNEY